MTRILSLLFFLLTTVIFAEAQKTGFEEFNGPYAGWANVKQRFSVKANGSADDTRGLQKALDELTVTLMNFNKDKDPYVTVYLPAGTYCISKTLTLRGKMGVNIIGEDPEKTIIKWVGGDDDTMFWANGSAYFKLSRIKWDANGKKNIKGVAIQWKEKWNDGKTRSFASLNIEVSDCSFVGALQNGIIGGTYGGQGEDGTGSNDSEITIRRCSFYNCAIGIVIRGFNALDYWVWDCRFVNCEIGLRNKHGNYHLFRSHFYNSKLSDIVNIGGYYVSVRGCYSKNANQFSVDSFNTCAPFKRIFRNNVVVGVKTTAIVYRHFGNLDLSGNYFEAAAGFRGDDLIFNYSGPSCGFDKLLSINNNFVSRSSYHKQPRKKEIEINDKVGGKQASTPAAPKVDSLESVPTYSKRTVFEVPVGANAAAIQKLIDEAYLLKGNKPVIHFPYGEFLIDKPLKIPAGSDMQLVGEGLIEASVLKKVKGSFKSLPIITIAGPTQVQIRDLSVAGDEENEGFVPAIHFTGIDQPASQVLIDQLYSQCKRSIWADKLDYTYIEKNNSFFSDGNYIDAGPLVAAGKGTHKLTYWGGQFAGTTLLNKASLTARDCWWEGEERTPLKLEGEGTLLVDGAMVAPRAMDSAVTFSIGNFKGQIALQNIYLVGGLQVKQDNKDLNLFLWNINFQYKQRPLDFIKKGANYKLLTTGLTFQCFNSKDPECTGDGRGIDDLSLNVANDKDYILMMTELSRNESPKYMGGVAANISGVYISRVTIKSCQTGLKFSK